MNKNVGNNDIPRRIFRNNMSSGIVDKKWSTYCIDIISKRNFVAEFICLQKLVYLQQVHFLKEWISTQTGVNMLEKCYCQTKIIR
jgi:hypothetical protein